MCHMHTREFSSVVNKSQMEFTGKCMDSQNIVLSRVTQVQKDKYCTFYFLCDSYLIMNTCQKTILNKR